MLKEVTHELEWNVKGSDKWIGITCWRKWHMNWNEMLNEVTHEMEWNVKEGITWNGRKCWKKCEITKWKQILLILGALITV